ncbi:MAG TPA: MFS transporter, partial [Xanthobacteraceae bacterium]|nr:MFS transporter [Xanthobacteraceae bacterium]
ANPLGSLTLLRSHRELLGLASVNFLGQLAHAVLPSVTVLYMGYRYRWDERTVGLVMAGVGVCAMVVQGALIGPVVRRFGERTALIAGLLFGAAGFATYGIAATGVVFLIGVPLMALWGFANPAALGLMSRRVGPYEQGQVQGANGSIAGVANMIGPGLFTQVFAAGIAPERSWQIPGAPFALAALMLLAAMVIALQVAEERANGE